MSSGVSCTRCSSLCHTDAWCPYKPTDYMESAIDFNVGIAAQRQRFAAIDYQIKDGDVVEFQGFGALDGTQYRVERLPGVDGWNVRLTEVRPL